MDKGSDIERALGKRSWSRLRELSLEPDGFLGYRDRVWPFLLHAESRIERDLKQNAGEDFIEKDLSNSSIVSVHDDERQVSLDVNRSFIVYPAVNHDDQKSQLQTELNELIVTFLRQHPSMHYFQGYHDIISVLLLTLPKSSRSACVETISLHRLRDAMGKGLEPMIGQLRILRNLMRIIDPAYAQVLESNAPLPYFSLSHLLTLFSHEVPTLRQIQHIFDFLLCRDPSAAIYLAAQVLLEKRTQILEAAEDGDDGMLHTTLSHWSLNESVVGTEDAPILSRKISSQSAGGLESISASTWKDDRAHDSSTGGHSQHNEHITLTDASPQASPSVEEQLSGLLKRTDQLRLLYPRTLAELRTMHILGPNSVFFTWSQHESSLLTDEETEKMILDQESIVYPYHPTPPVSDDEDATLKHHGTQRTVKRKVARPARFVGPGAVVTSTLLVLGVAIVMYNGRPQDLAQLSPGLPWTKLVDDLPWLRRLYR